MLSCPSWQTNIPEMKTLFCSCYGPVLWAPCQANLLSSRTWNQLWDWAEGGLVATRWTTLDTLVPCQICKGLLGRRQQPSERFALSSGSCSNPRSAEQNCLQRLKKAAVSLVAPPDPFVMTCPKKSAAVSLCRDLNADEKNIVSARGNSSSQVFLYAKVMWLSTETCPTPHGCYFHGDLRALSAIVWLLAKCSCRKKK